MTHDTLASRLVPARLVQVYRKTKIIATAGPSCSDAATLKRMVVAGMDVLRINMAHSDRASHAAVIARYRAVCAELGAQACVCVDLQGSELRTCWLVDKATREHIDSVALRAGQQVTLCGLDSSAAAEFVGWSQGDDTRLAVGLPELGKRVRVGSVARMADGSVSIRVDRIVSDNEVVGTVQSDCKLGSHKMASIEGLDRYLPFLSRKDIEDVEWAVAQRVECVAASFTRSQEDMQELQALLRGCDAPRHTQCAPTA